MLKREQLEQRLQHIVEGVQGIMSLHVDVNGESFMLGPQERFSAASLIKVPIMLAAFLKAQEGQLDLTQRILVPESEKVGGSGVISLLSPGMSFHLIDLITLMIIVSDNTATNMCIDAVGLPEINTFLAKVGCLDTILGRRLMDYEARRSGKDNFITARDMIAVYKELWQGSILNASFRQKALDILYHQQFRDKLPRRLPETDGGHIRIAHKTGELQGIEHDAGILVIDGKPAFIAALTRDLVDLADGRAAIGEVGLAVYNYMTEIRWLAPLSF